VRQEMSVVSVVEMAPVVQIVLFLDNMMTFLGTGKVEDSFKVDHPLHCATDKCQVMNVLRITNV